MMPAADLKNMSPAVGFGHGMSWARIAPQGILLVRSCSSKHLDKSSLNLTEASHQSGFKREALMVGWERGTVQWGTYCVMYCAPQTLPRHNLAL